MIIDVDLSKFDDRAVFFTIPEPVMQRLFNGRTKGLALFPLGSIHASFYASESDDDNKKPKLHFNLK